MHDREVYRQILGLKALWEITDEEIDLPGTGVTVQLFHSASDLACLQRGVSCSGCDIRECKWRHLNTCHYKTWLIAHGPDTEHKIAFDKYRQKWCEALLACEAASILTKNQYLWCSILTT